MEESQVFAPETVAGSTDVLTSLESNSETEQRTYDASDFRSLLSDDLKSHPSLQEYKNLNGLANSHVELKKMLGNRIRLPDENSTEEQINKFYNKLGRPESPDGYEFNEPEELPEGFVMNEDEIKEFKDLSHKLGLTNKQADNLRKTYIAKAVELHKLSYINPEQKSAEQEADFIEKSKKMFGEKSEFMLQNATKLMKENLTEDQINAIDKFDNDGLLAITSLVNNMNSKFFKPDSSNTSYAPVNTMEQSRSELISLKEQFKKMDKFHPQYKETESKINNLYAKGVKLYTK